MNKIKLISEQFIKDFSSLMNNVEDQFLSIHILEAQNIELRYSLGDDLYNEIIEQYTEYAENGYQNIDNYVSTQNQKLRDDYIKWILLYYTLYHSIYDLNSKLSNKGIEKQHSSYSINADNYNIENRRRDYKNKAEIYVSRMLKYINDNINLFPKYKNFFFCETNRNSFDSQWYLGDNLI